jgi:hypothetical protein
MSAHDEKATASSMGSMISELRIAWPFRLVIAVVLLLATTDALAQTADDKSVAHALQVEGLRLMQKSDFGGALAKFDEAFRRVQSPKILFNRGKARQALGQEVGALEDFERFLDEAPYAPKESRREAQTAVDTLRPKLAYIEVQTEDANSLISIDGRPVGQAPLARPSVVTPGPHEVRVEKVGAAPEVRHVSPIGGQKVRVVVKLMAAQPPPEVAPATTSRRELAAPAAPAAEVPPAPAGAPAATPPAPPDAAVKHTPWQVTVGRVGIGVTVLLAGGGVAAQLASSSKNSDFNAVANAPNPTKQCNHMLAGDGGGPCAGLRQDAARLQTWAIVGFVAAGLAAVATTLLLVTAPSPSSGADVAAACGPASTSGGLSCGIVARF